jgi:hypothetical protein
MLATTLCDKVGGAPVSSTNKTEIKLKVALNIIINHKPNNKWTHLITTQDSQE